MIKKGKPEKKNEISFNSRTTNHIKAKINNTQKNNKCQLFHKRNEMVNQMIREFKSMHDWVGKEIHWKLCKRLKFGYADKLFIHKLGVVLENEMQKILSEFELQTDNQILIREQTKS